MRPYDKAARRALVMGLASAAVTGANPAKATPEVPGSKPSSAPPSQNEPTTPRPGPAVPTATSPSSSRWPGTPTETAPIQIDLPQLRYAGQWSPRAGAMRVLARELRLRTRLEPVSEPSTVDATSSELFETPFVYVAGEGGLPSLGAKAERQLRRFVDLGGLMLFDAADGGTDSGFVQDVRALLTRISPGSSIAPVGRDHVLFRSFYLIDSPAGRTLAHDHLLGIQEEGRLKALIMRNDLGGALAETETGLAAFPCTPGGSQQREWAIRFGVNVLLYATCTDYKADRAHVETLLRSRRWR